MSLALASARPSEDAVLGTREAGRLVGRTEDAIRAAIRGGTLPGERGRDFWYVRASDVIAWAARTRRGRGKSLAKPRTDEVVELLKEYGSVSTDDVATLLQVHPGNARKYLAMLGLQGRAYRRPDGQWALVDESPDEEAPKSR
jgi:hypothetical protein